MGNERVQCAVHEAAQDDQGGYGLAGIASSFPIFESDIGVGGISTGELYRRVVRLLGARRLLDHEQTGAH